MLNKSSNVYNIKMMYQTLLDLHESFCCRNTIDLNKEYRTPNAPRMSKILSDDWYDWPGLFYTLDINNNLVQIGTVENLKKMQNFMPDDREMILVCNIAYPGDREYRYNSIRSVKQKIKRIAVKNYNAGFGYTFIGSPDIRNKFKGITIFPSYYPP